MGVPFAAAAPAATGGSAAMNAATGAAIGAAGQATGGLLGFRHNKIQMDFSRDMYWQQRHHADQDWRRAAAYNHPKQQMARLKEAGLNPNLIYGKGGNLMPSPTSQQAKAMSPNTRAPQFDFSKILEGAAKTQEIKNIAAQNKLIQSQTMLNKSAAEKNIAQAKNVTEYTTNILPQTLANMEEQQRTLQSQQAMNTARISLMNAQTLATKSNAEAQMNQSKAALINAGVNEKRAEAYVILTTIQGLKMQAERKFMLAKTKTERAKYDQVLTEIAKAESQTNLNTQQFEMTAIGGRQASTEIGAVKELGTALITNIYDIIKNW
jgi:hypothetical protein